MPGLMTLFRLQIAYISALIFFIQLVTNAPLASIHVKETNTNVDKAFISKYTACYYQETRDRAHHSYLVIELLVVKIIIDNCQKNPAISSIYKFQGAVQVQDCSSGFRLPIQY